MFLGVSIMTIYGDILSDFFNELQNDNDFPNEIMEDLKILLQKEKIKSYDIISIIKREDFDANKD